MADAQAECGFDPKKIKKILVVRNDNLGDVICTTPAIEALRLAYPKAFIAALVADYTKDALTGNPYLDKVYAYVKAKHSSSTRLKALGRQWGVLREVQREGFDLAIGIRSRFTKSHGWLVYMSRARYRVGHKPEDASLLSARFYNIYVDDEDTVNEAHEVERSLNCVRRIGIDIKDKRLSLFVGDEELNTADSFIKAKGLKKKKIVCLHITSRPEHNREWPVSSYIRVVDALSALPGVAVVLNWLPKDARAAREISGKVNTRPEVFESSTLKGFAAFLKRSAALVTLEGGAMHIGATQATPVVAIFGRTSTNVWAPWGVGNITLQNGDDASSVTAGDVVEATKIILSR